MKARKSSRVSLTATGTIRSPRAMQWDVPLADLSQGGCRVDDMQGRLKLGEFVRLFIAGTGPHMAEVAWRQGGNVGLAFTRPLPERVFILLASAEWEEAAKAYGENSGSGAPRRFV